MAKTVVALYDNLETARDVVRDLVNNNFDRDNVSLMAADREGYREHDYVTDYDEADFDRGTTYRDYDYDVDEESATAEGAGIGAVIGGLTGLVVGLGAITIPGLGPIIAAGPIVSTLVGAGVGAAAGGVLGALVDLGVPEEHAEYYAEGVRRGGTLVAVQATDARANDAVDIMERHDPIDIDRRVSRWEERGWTGFDPDAGPYTREGVERGYATDEEAGLETRSGRRARLYGEQSGDLGAYTDYEPTFRQHYETAYGTTDYDYTYYRPAYRYGYDLATHEQYSGREWTDVEPEARRRWEEENEGTWEQVKDAVRHAWREARRRI